MKQHNIQSIFFLPLNNRFYFLKDIFCYVMKESVKWIKQTFEEGKCNHLKKHKIAYTMMLSFGGNKQTKNQQLLLLWLHNGIIYFHNNTDKSPAMMKEEKTK